MCEDIRELIASDMGDERYECPLCLDYVSKDEKCSCNMWSEAEIKEYTDWLKSIE